MRSLRALTVLWQHTVMLRDHKKSHKISNKTHKLMEIEHRLGKADCLQFTRLKWSQYSNSISEIMWKKQQSETLFFFSAWLIFSEWQLKVWVKSGTWSSLVEGFIPGLNGNKTSPKMLLFLSVENLFSWVGNWTQVSEIGGTCVQENKEMLSQHHSCIRKAVIVRSLISR